eukprot:CAMPEP_0198266030 /NCGR_PEP_ID=MMETSP1447-20131203/26132_1 /TAXON_ID=420782 /ORGANISM="Chaetoceros dichaeta, Strain CCMP1751" /LENGTH=584 /DNA_ID=CAMNT_0043955865 /DNA_START=179 /DNA_END=1933 /DNA_ORIENTATION=+
MRLDSTVATVALYLIIITLSSSSLSSSDAFSAHQISNPPSFSRAIVHDDANRNHHHFKTKQSSTNKQKQKHFVVASRSITTKLHVASNAGGSGSGNGNGNSSNTNTNSSLRMPTDRASTVVSTAFEALGEKDQYDAVLTGLCAKILDGKYQPNSSSSSNAGNEDVAIDGNGSDGGTSVGTTATQRAFENLRDPIRLMNEMNARKIQASERSLMALIDATAVTQDPRAMSSILSLSLRNGSLNSYGALQTNVLPFPPSPNSSISRITNNNNRRTTRSERLQKLPPLPTDERDIESAAAITTLTTAATCLLLQTGVGEMLVGFENYEYVSPLAGLTLAAMGTVGVVDNFFDVLSMGGSLLVKTNADRLPDAVTEAEVAKAEDMPFELGSGKLTSNITRGLTRLLSVDTERECQCEAASFFVAYSLGLPCFSLRPNALEAAVLMFESHKQDDLDDDGSGGGSMNALDTLLSDAGMMKMLVWLLAPVAMESSLHPQLIASEPREARGLLKRLEEKASFFGVEDILEGILHFDGDDEEKLQERGDLLRWAYAEADLLLRDNKSTIVELSERLIGGASTIGDCVAVIEEW